jgi:hypothetical protein
VTLDWIGAPPAPGDLPSASARVHLRYEDVTQDGRVLLEVLPNALGSAIWSAQLEKDPFALECLRRGIVPILTRFVLEGTPGPFGVGKPLDAVGRWALGRVLNEEGVTEKLVVNMWAELSGPIGRTYPPPPEGAGTIAPAGRIFAEHVFTRLFAPPGQRRVTSLDEVPGAPGEPLPYAPRPLASMLDLPEGARPLDEMHAEDEVVFGVMHTDSNQHVNSLVYLRVFEELALRRFAALGRRDAVLSRKLEIAYRKPCFAGDRVRVALRAFEHEGALGVVGELVGSKGGVPHSAVRIVFG